MSRSLIRIIPASIILMMVCITSFAQTDREFWFAAPDVDEVNSPLYGFYDRPIYLRITSFTISADVTISIPANPSFTPINITIPANSTSTIDLTTWIDQIENFQPNIVANKGLYIQSTNDITVYYEVNSQTCKCNPELFALKGKNALGNNFYIPSQLTWSIDTVRHPNAKAAFDLVATEDNTSVTIIPSKPLIGRPANTPFTILLNKGESFSSQALYRKGSLLLNGSKITSTKPIAVTTKEDLLFGDGPCADLAGDQLVPENILGTEYAVVRGNLTTGDKVAITATQNNTNIYLDGNATPVATINAGQLYEANISNTQPSLHIRTDKLVYVLHYTGNGCEVGSAIIPKLSCTGSKSVSIVRSNSGNGTVLIVVKNGLQNSFLVNGNPGIINAADFSPLNGTGGNYVFCKKDVTASMILNTAATFSNSAGKFQLGFINGDPGGYMYGYFSDFKKSNVTTTQTEICKFDSAQLIAFGGLTYQWSPPTGLSNPNINNPKASPLATTDYRVLITDEDGCTDSAFVKVVVGEANFDFNFEQDACNPFAVQFNGVGNNVMNPYWSFGDGNTNTGNYNPSNIYVGAGNYTVKYTVIAGSCNDTITKVISLNLVQDNQLVLTPDTTICYGSTKKLRTSTALNFCWTPTTYLDDPTIPEPTTSTPENITYHYTAEVTGNNIITNGDFSSGNSGFTSEYQFANPNIAEGQYFVGSSPQAWNNSLSNCTDHTSNNGNMLLVNGSPAPDVKVWTQTVTITPNTNYAFSTWIQALYPPNPAQLSFSINGQDIGNLITASLPTCTWSQFYTTWNAGSNTSATISIVNKNTLVQGNDFALDDISFAPVFIKTDSIKITVDTANVITSADTDVCEKIPVQLNTTGGSTYSWTPVTGLSDPAIANPVATPSVTTEYIVTGITANGCSAKDTVVINISPAPVITITSDTTICTNSSLQLMATGGNTYSWTPATSLDNPNISNPVAAPAANTLYYVTVTTAANCSNMDSVQVNIRPPAVFTVSNDKIACLNDTVQLSASGGDMYAWQPQASLDDATISNPTAVPAVTTTYSVTISETTCNESATLSTTITVLPLPVISASKSNDIDCSISESRLNATGGATYRWSPGSTLNDPFIPNPVATPLTTTQYTVTGTDASGCKNTDTVTVKATATNIGLYQMPTAFTPNGDGLNDCYGLKYWGFIEELDFSIYNRWGERVFHSTNPAECWDGYYKGIKQSSGVFVYMIKAKTSCAPSVFRKGTFALIR